MLRKKLSISVLLVLLVFPAAFAYSGSLYYDKFFDTAEVETIILYPFNASYSAYYVNSEVYNMSSNGNYWYINIANNETGDFPFYVTLFNGTFESYNASDGIRESYFLLENNSLIYGKFSHTDTHVAGTIAKHNICGLLSKNPTSSSDPVVKFFAGINVSGSYDVTYSDDVVVSSLSYISYCTDLDQIYNNATAVNDSEIFGLYCSNCDLNTGLRVGTSTNNIVGVSKINGGVNISEEVNLSNDLVVYSLEFENADPNNIFFFDGVGRWRDAFYVNITLFEQVRDSNNQIQEVLYGGDFDYIYSFNDDLYGDSYVPDDAISSTMNRLPDFGADFNMLNWARDREYVFYWSVLDSGFAQVKFYEPGNYTFYLRSVEQNGGVAIDEFAKPEFSDSDIDSTKIATLSLNGSDVSYAFKFNELEVRVWEFYRNIFIYLGAFIIWAVIVGGIIYVTGDVKIGLTVGVGLATVIFGGAAYLI